MSQTRDDIFHGAVRSLMVDQLHICIVVAFEQCPLASLVQ